MTTLAARTRAILVSPRTEWPAIAAEDETVPGLYLRFIMPLAAIGPLAFVIRFASAGWLGLSVLQYLVQLATIYATARVIQWLAPRFKSEGDTVQAIKLVAYAATPAWIGAVLNAVPSMGILATAALLYSVYLYYLGLPAVMRTPIEQVVPYMLVSAIALVAGFIVASRVVGIVIGGLIGILRL